MPTRIRNSLISAVLCAWPSFALLPAAQQPEAATPGLLPARIYATISAHDADSASLPLIVEYWDQVAKDYPDREIRVYSSQDDGGTFVSVADAPGAIGVMGAYLTSDPDLNRRYHEAFQQTSAAQVLVAGTIPAGGVPRAAAKATLWRECRAKASEFARARELAAELVEHVNATYPELAARVFVRESGPYGVLEFFFDYPNRWQWEIFDARFREDRIYSELEHELLERMIEGSVHDEWWTHVL